jgi:hypothetical protein
MKTLVSVNTQRCTFTAYSVLYELRVDWLSLSKRDMSTMTTLQRSFFRVQSISLPSSNFRGIECLSKALGVSHFGINPNFANDVGESLNDQS